MSEPLRVGVVGVGHLGRHHARLWSAMPETRVVGIVDTNADRARAVGEEFGVPVLPDIGSLREEAQAVSVAVPTVAHAEIACDFLGAGIGVLVEKPIAPDLDSADRILAAAESTGAALMVGHTERFNPAVGALAARAKRPLFIESHRLGAFSARSLDVDVVLDLMIHDLDVILSLVGQPVESIDATGVEAMTDKIDIANARIRFAGGAVANVTASRISADRIRKLRVFEPRSYASLDYAEQSLRAYSLVEQDGERPRIECEDVAVEKDEPLRLELEAFRDTVAAGVPPAVSGAQARSALELALRIVDRIHATRPLG